MDERRKPQRRHQEDRHQEGRHQEGRRQVERRHQEGRQQAERRQASRQPQSQQQQRQQQQPQASYTRRPQQQQPQSQPTRAQRLQQSQALNARQSQQQPNYAQPQPQQQQQQQQPQQQQTQRVSAPRKKGLSKREIATVIRWRRLTITAFKAVMGIGLVLGLCFFLRPTYSESENRMLTTFPEFTWESFVDGSYTEGISTWYADTYPFREQLMALNHAMTSLFGIHSGTQVFGVQKQGEEIPSEGKTTKAPAPLPEDYTSADLEAAIQGEILNGAFVKDGACYSHYYFTQSAAEAYAHAVNTAKEDLGDAGTVYSILIPNNSGVMLSDAENAALGGSNQGQAIEYYYSLYDEGVKTVPTTDTLRAHNNEYLYFKTDHHWTALGAYYVYRNFCETKGVEPHEASSLQEMDFAGFQGTYIDTLESAGMGSSTDVVQAWVPNGTNDMVYYQYGTIETEWNVIRDVSDWSSGAKYSCFIGGDQPWSVIHNPAITDGSSCVVIKESYGNAYVPWLVDHYENVYVADFRYCDINVVDFMKENGVQDLILINNISIIGSEAVSAAIEELL